MVKRIILLGFIFSTILSIETILNVNCYSYASIINDVSYKISTDEDALITIPKEINLYKDYNKLVDGYFILVANINIKNNLQNDIKININSVDNDEKIKFLDNLNIEILKGYEREVEIKVMVDESYDFQKFIDTKFEISWDCGSAKIKSKINFTEE